MLISRRASARIRNEPAIRTTSRASADSTSRAALFADTDPLGRAYRVRERYLTDAQASYSFRGAPNKWLRDTRLTAGVRNLARS